MSRTYLRPEAEGYLLEADACGKVVKELQRVADKLQRKVEREEEARQAEFVKVMEYQSELEIQDAYGYGFLTETQYSRFLELYRSGQEALDNHPPTVTEVALRIVRRILSDIDAEQREWIFAALTPAQQQAELDRAAQSAQAWKRKIAEIKERKLGLLDHGEADTQKGGYDVPE